MKALLWLTSLVVSLVLTALTFYDPWIELLSAWVGQASFADPVGSLTGFPVYQLPEYGAVDVGGLREEAIRLVWPEIVRPVHLLLALLLLFHTLFWGVMGERKWARVFRGIDYVWYLGAAAALVLAASDFVVSKAFNRAYVATQDYEEAKRLAQPLLARMKRACSEGTAAEFELDGRKRSICSFYVFAPDYWKNDNPLCENYLVRGGRFADIDTWRGGSSSVNFSYPIDPVACAERPVRFMTCMDLQRIADLLIGPETDPPPVQTGPYDLSYVRMVELKRRHPAVVDAFRMCRLMSVGREIAGEIGASAKVQLAMAGGQPLRDAWLMVLAFAIAIRLVKTTADIRDSPPLGWLPRMRRSKVLLLPLGAVAMGAAAAGLFAFGYAAVTDGWRLPYVGWGVPIARWAVALLAGLAVLACLAGLVAAGWLVERLDPTMAAADDRDVQRQERARAVRIACLIGLLVTLPAAGWVYGWI